MFTLFTLGFSYSHIYIRFFSLRRVQLLLALQVLALPLAQRLRQHLAQVNNHQANPPSPQQKQARLV